MITIDADLQHPSEAIPKLITKFDEGHETPFNTFGASLNVSSRSGDFGIPKAYVLVKRK